MSKSTKRDIIIYDERNRLSNELFGKPEVDLNLAEKLKLDQYIHDTVFPKWKHVIIDGHDSGYQISNIGKVIGPKGSILKEYVHPKTGYCSIGIPNGKCITTLVHRLVAEYFIPNPDNKVQVNHINGKKTLNWVGNLEWNTFLENMQHAVNTGLLDIKGDKHPENKYSEDQIRKVCELLQDTKKTPAQIELETGVSRDLIGKIRIGNTWTHISSQYTIPDVNFMSQRILYTDKKIDEVCRLLSDPRYSVSSIFSMTGVNKNTINDIVRGRRWKRISKNYNIPKKRAGSINRTIKVIASSPIIPEKASSTIDQL